MGILMIGIARVTILVRGLAFRTATESTSEKRRTSRAGGAQSPRQDHHHAA
ncbi:hypothetical protein [Nitrospira sp. Kam-Ns4a]